MVDASKTQDLSAEYTNETFTTINKSISQPNLKEVTLRKKYVLPDIYRTQKNYSSRQTVQTMA